MKITAFNPLIITSHAAEAVALFEELGFKQAHTKTSIPGDITGYDLKYGEDFRVDIAKVDSVPQDMTTIRMNVRDFDEAYDFLISKGFKDVNNGEATDTGSSKATMLVSPSGFSISIVQHISK